VNPEQLILTMGLTFLCGVGPKRAKKILAHVGDVETLFSLSDQQLSNRLSLPLARIRSWKRTEAIQQAKLEFQQISKRGITAHSYLDNTYPRRLKQCEDAPLLLYALGNFNTNPTRSIAIVGTRNQTAYGSRLTVELVEALKQADIQVVSGLAHGVDTLAHRTSIDTGIETVGVLGHGLDRIYPAANRGLAKRMLAKGGLITEYITGTDPDREHFPMRNRIVAGMVDAVVVVESMITGGSLITASLANDYNRDVFAFPGNIGEPYSAGCNRLIKDNKAMLVESGADLLTLMNWTPSLEQNKQHQCLVELTEPEKLVFDLVLPQQKEHIDVIAVRSRIPISNLNVILFHLEMKGFLRQLPGKMYARM